MAFVRLNPRSHAVVGHLFNLLANIGMACLLCYATDLKNPRAGWLCAPWLRWFGLISFECYLFHLPMLLFALALFDQAGGGMLKHIGIVGLSLLVTLALAALVYLKFSLPILKIWTIDPRFKIMPVAICRMMRAWKLLERQKERSFHGAVIELNPGPAEYRNEKLNAALQG